MIPKKQIKRPFDKVRKTVHSDIMNVDILWISEQFYMYNSFKNKELSYRGRAKSLISKVARSIQ